MESKPGTVHKALNISDKWMDESEAHLNKEVEATETLSETLLLAAARLKKELFGDTDHPISEYEKKLLLTGMQLSNLMMKIQADRVKVFLGEVMKVSSQDKSPE